MSLVTCWPPTRHDIGEDEIAFGEHGDRCRAAAHVDQRDTPRVAFVIDEAGEAGRHIPDSTNGLRFPAWRARHRSERCASGPTDCRDDMHIDAEPRAHHTARFTNTGRPIDGEGSRDGMHHFTLTGLGHGPSPDARRAGGPHPRSRDRRQETSTPTVCETGSPQDRFTKGALDGLARHTFGGVDRAPRMAALGSVKIDYRSGLVVRVRPDDRSQPREFHLAG